MTDLDLKGELRMDIEAPLLGTMKVTLDARDLAKLAEALLPALQRLGVVVRYTRPADGE